MPAPIITEGDLSSQARYLFDLYTGTDGIAAIEALPHQPTKAFETNWLEFKSGLVRDDDLKHLWSKALGSFANSGGGVVIWGVRAERDATNGIDAVQEVVPVPDVHRLANRLKALQPAATDPPIQGVVIQPLLLPSKEPTGFVVCLVPESTYKPHRSEWGKNDVKRFNMRIGDSTQECTVPILRQLFYPRAVVSAQLELKAGQLPVSLQSMVFREPNGDELIGNRLCSVSMRIKNTGPISIHEPVLDLDSGTVHVGTVSRRLDTSEWVFEFFHGSAQLTQTLHPGRTDERHFVFGYRIDNLEPRLFFTLYARDLLPLSAEIAYNEVVEFPWTTKTIPLLARHDHR